MTKRFGFTLAEVLITLGIIGVVAAMTMPTLINQTNGAQYKAAYKKALSAISQAVTLNVALDDISFAEVNGTTANDVRLDEDILSKRMNIVSRSVPNNYAINTPGTDNANRKVSVPDSTNNVTLFFNDGSMFTYKKADAINCTDNNNVNGHHRCLGYIDVNGVKGPNKVVTCDSGTNTAQKPCEVKSPTDIYPVEFYDQTIGPNTVAAKAVLYGN